METPSWQKLPVTWSHAQTNTHSHTSLKTLNWNRFPSPSSQHLRSLAGRCYLWGNTNTHTHLSPWHVEDGSLAGIILTQGHLLPDVMWMCVCVTLGYHGVYLFIGSERCCSHTNSYEEYLASTNQEILPSHMSYALCFFYWCKIQHFKVKCESDEGSSQCFDWFRESLSYELSLLQYVCEYITNTSNMPLKCLFYRICQCQRRLSPHSNPLYPTKFWLILHTMLQSL